MDSEHASIAERGFFSSCEKNKKTKRRREKPGSEGEIPGAGADTGRED